MYDAFMVARKRARPTISLTLNERTLAMLQIYAEKRLGNRSEAIDDIVARYTFLMQEADLSDVSFSAFETLCMLVDGVITTNMAAPRPTLLGCVFQKLADQDDFRRTLETKPIGFFRDDSRESRAAFIEKLDAERDHLDTIVALLKSFDQTQNMALLEYIEEVLGDKRGDDVAARCQTAYDRMQDRSHGR